MSGAGPIVTSRRDWRRIGLVALAVVVLAGTVVSARVLPRWLNRCPSPATSVTGESAVKAQGSLLAHLPEGLPGFDAQYPQAQTVMGLEHGAALDDAGFLYGYYQVHQRGELHVDITVFQFQTVAGAEQFEASEVRQLCRGTHRRMPVKEVEGVSSVAVPTRSGAMTRVGLIRGSRLFAINLAGAAVPRTLREDLTREVAALAS